MAALTEELDRLGIWADHYPQLRQFLQCETIFSYLVQKKLLTQDQQSELAFSPLGPFEKVNRLLQYIPRSRPDFLEDFIDCLRLSADGTHHGELANALQSALDKAKLQVEKVSGAAQLMGTEGITVGRGQDEDSSSGQSDEAEPLILGTDRPEPNKTCWRKNWKFNTLISMICLAVSAALILGACLGALLGPGVHDYSVDIHRNDTILIPIRPSSQIVHKLGLQTNPEDACNGLALLLPCSDLQLHYIQNVSLRFFTSNREFIYLLTGSTMHFFLRDERKGSANVWIFNDYGVYKRYRDDLDDLDCSPANFPKGAHCIPLNLTSPTGSFPIKKSSYYFFSCSPDFVSCVGNLRHTIDLYWYNYVDYLNCTAAVSYVSSGSPTEIVVHQKKFDVSFSREVQMCLLLHIYYSSADPEEFCPSEHSTLSVRGIEINQAVWLFASFSVVVAGAVTGVGLCCCCWYHRRQRKQTPRAREYQQSLHLPERSK